MKDLLIIVILVAIVGAAVWYVYKAKKNGKKCIGCPDGGCSSCSDSSQSSCCCGCSSTEK